MQLKGVMKHFLKILYDVCIWNPCPSIYNIHSFIASSGLIWSYKNMVSISQTRPPNSESDVILVTTMASDIGVRLETMGEQTMLQPCFRVVAPHGVHLFSYFITFV